MAALGFEVEVPESDLLESDLEELESDLESLEEESFLESLEPSLLPPSAASYSRERLRVP